MQLIKTITILLAFSLFSCMAKKKSSDLPKSLVPIVESFSKNPPCKDAHVDEFEFQGKIVYAFIPGTCGADMGTDVYDALGNKLGMLGGITGKTSINGEDFDKAILKKTVWKNN